jgi:hypothetical protein
MPIRTIVDYETRERFFPTANCLYLETELFLAVHGK